MQINQQIEESQESGKNNKAKIVEEIQIFEIAVETVQKKLQDNISNVSLRLREQDNKIAQQVNVEQLELQREFEYG
jgi:hypothetical protein